MELKTYFAQDASGNIMPGATVTVYEAGTATLSTGLQDESGSPLANPFTADSSAKVAFYAPDGLYDITVVGNGRTVTIRAQFVSVDGASVLRADLAATGGSALVGFQQAGTGAVATTVQSKLLEVVSVKDFGAVLDGVANDATALFNANAAAAAAKVPLLIPGVMHIGTATTITAPIVDGLHQMFSTNSSVTVGNGLPVRPEWFGSTAWNLIRAVAALPAIGGTVQMVKADYNIVGAYDLPGAIGNTKKNVILRGAGMPEKAVDRSRFVSGSGTVIQGHLLNFASGFQAWDLGVDCGTYVVDTLNGGAHLDGFVPCTLTSLSVVYSDLASYTRDLHFGNISALLKPAVEGTAATYKHGILIEHAIGVSHGYLETEGGYHGYVIKSQDVTGDSVKVLGTLGTSYIIKSDEYSHCTRVNIGRINIGSAGYPTRTGAGLLESRTGSATSRINIGSIVANKCQSVFQQAGASTGFITDINIGQIIADDVQGNPVFIADQMVRVNIDQHILNNCTSYGVHVYGGQQIHIGDGSVTNSATDGYRFANNATLTHGKLNAVANAGYGVSQDGSINLDLQNITGSANTSGLFSGPLILVDDGGLLNGWVSETLAGGNHPFSVYKSGNRVYVVGGVNSGTNATICNIPPAGRPVGNLIIPAAGYNGSAFVQMTLAVTASGNISLANPTSAVIVFFNFSYLV